MNRLNALLARNLAWAKEKKVQNPYFFSKLSGQQSPQYLWIGCSDSRVPANEIVGLPPGEVFVHRNIANVVVHTDLNCLSVIQYAVDVLQVKHIIVCGHYGCGGVQAAMENQKHGLIDNWLRHIKDVMRLNKEQLKGLDDDKKLYRFCELNVIEQVRNVCNTTIVQDDWGENQELTIHGWIYSIADGILRDLDVCVASKEDLANKYKCP
jgi:carbonic anhydrase